MQVTANVDNTKCKTTIVSYNLTFTRHIVITSLKTKKPIYIHEMELDSVNKDPKCRGGEIENTQISLTLGNDIYIN